MLKYWISKELSDRREFTHNNKNTIHTATLTKSLNAETHFFCAAILLGSEHTFIETFPRNIGKMTTNYFVNAFVNGMVFRVAVVRYLCIFVHAAINWLNGWLYNQHALIFALVLCMHEAITHPPHSSISLMCEKCRGGRSGDQDHKKNKNNRHLTQSLSFHIDRYLQQKHIFKTIKVTNDEVQRLTFRYQINTVSYVLYALDMRQGHM